MFHIFKGHLRFVSSVAFSSDGKHILSGSADKSAHLWTIPMALEEFLKKGNLEPLSAEQKKEFGIEEN